MEMRGAARRGPVGRRARTAGTRGHGDADDAALVGWWGRWRYAGRVMWALRDGVLREPSCGGQALRTSGGGCRRAAGSGGSADTPTVGLSRGRRVRKTGRDLNGYAPEYSAGAVAESAVW